MTDHSSLTSFFKKANINSLQARWTSFLSEFDFNIKNMKEKENWMVDALSRKLHCVYEIPYSQIEFNFTNHIKEVSLRDLEYEFLWLQTK